MITVTQTELRNHIRKYISAVERGEEVEICRSGKPVAALVPRDRARVPHWKQPRELLVLPGVSVSKMIIEERRRGW
jgi:prevent-host-death family protein